MEDSFAPYNLTPCTSCGGSGVREHFDPNSEEWYSDDCDTCDGSGEVYDWENIDYYDFDTYDGYDD